MSRIVIVIDDIDRERWIDIFQLVWQISNLIRRDRCVKNKRFKYEPRDERGRLTGEEINGEIIVEEDLSGLKINWPTGEDHAEGARNPDTTEG